MRFAARGRRSGRRGFSLLEIIVAFAILVVVLLAVLAFVASAGQAQRLQSERALARGRGLAKLAELRAKLHEASWAGDGAVASAWTALLAEIGNWNPTTGVAQTSATSPITVILRGKAANDPDKVLGTTGSVEARVSIEASSNENTIEAAFGLTQIDVNANGEYDDLVVDPAQLRLLPVRVTVTWTSEGGDTMNQSVVGLLY